MGTWGIKNFQNDIALDWVIRICASMRTEMLERTLNNALLEHVDDVAESVYNYETLAAAELVAAAFGNSSIDIPPEANEWLHQQKLEDIRSLRPLAISAVRRVKTNSELRRLWECENALNEWTPVLEDLMDRLRAD